MEIDTKLGEVNQKIALTTAKLVASEEQQKQDTWATQRSFSFTANWRDKASIAKRIPVTAKVIETLKKELTILQEEKAILQSEKEVILKKAAYDKEVAEKKAKIADEEKKYSHESPISFIEIE